MVQKENSVLEEIKLIVDDSDERGLFVLSGSQKLELIKGMSESSAGRMSVSELAGILFIICLNVFGENLIALPIEYI